MNAPAPDEPELPLDPIVFNEMQLLLAEKRTALSTLRTGLAIFAFPLTALSALIATSRFYELHKVLHWLLPLLLINIGLLTLAIFLVVRAIRRLLHYDRIMEDLKSRHTRLRKLLL